MTPLRLDCRPLPAGTETAPESGALTGVVISVAGELDATNADDLESSIGRMRHPGRPLVLDLGALTFMDSTGLHVLLRVHRQVRQDGGSFHLAAVRDLPARLLQITEVWDALDIHPSTDAAIAALSSAFGPTTRLERPSCG